jgi:preprotein translocase subunit YajC
MTTKNPSLSIAASRRCGLVFLILVGLSGYTNGEDAPLQQSLAPGMRVRIQAPDVLPGKVVGKIDKVSDESVSIDVPGRSTPLSIVREKITRLDVSEGSRSRGIDAAIGGGIGAGAGAIVGAAVGGRSNTHLVSTGGEAAVCALLGALLGALIGAEIPPGEHWNEIPAAYRYRIGFAPRLDHGLALAVAWNF